MNLWRRFVAYVVWLRRGSRFDRELDVEMTFHIDSRVDELVSGGWSRPAAVTQARREFGSPARAAEDTRAAWQIRWMENLVTDLRYTARACRRSPAFVCTVVGSLALGIGATTAMLSAMNALLWRPLNVKAPDRLVRIQLSGPNEPAEYLPVAFVNRFRTLPVFDGVAAYAADGVSFAFDRRAERAIADAVDAGYFRTLGVTPAVGRDFTPPTAAHPWEPEVILSHRFWQERFGGDRSVIGKAVTVNTEPFTIIGVLPQTFSSLTTGFDPDLRLPMLPEGRSNPRIAQLGGTPGDRRAVIARLAAGVSIEQAGAAAEVAVQDVLATVSPQMRAQFQHARLTPGGRSDVSRVDHFRTSLIVLLSLGGVVLLIAGINAASLLLARANARRLELSVRVSIGAGRARIVRQLVTESVALAIVAGVLGMGLAIAATAVMERFVPQGHSNIVVDFHPELRIFALAFGLAVLVGSLIGLGPGLSVSRADLASAVRANRAATSFGRARTRQWLVAGQIAFALTLLVLAGLFVRTVSVLRPTGFQVDPARVLVLTIKPQQELYDPPHMRQLTSELQRRIGLIPAVTSVALAETGPFASRQYQSAIDTGGGTSIRIPSDFVTPEFFDTVGIRRIAGRDFTAADATTSRPVAIINEALARKLFPNASAIGQTLRRAGEASGRTFDIVGVVADVPYHDARQAAPPTAFYPILQSTPYMPTLIVRTAGDTNKVLTAVLQTLDAFDTGFPVFNIRTLADRLDDGLSDQRLAADFAAAFGTIALLLSAIGLYGVLAYRVSSRTREIGVRMALGSTSASVLWLMSREAIVLVIAGGVTGMGLAFAASRVLASQLAVSALDPSAFSAGALVMFVVGALAASVPAYRASRINPVTALTAE